MVNRLLQTGIRHVQVTIDGTREIHDLRKPFKNGRGTWNTIIQNIIIASSKIPVVIRINVDAHNIDNIPTLLDLLVQEEFRYIREIYFSPTLRTLNPLSSWNQYIWDPAEKAEKMIWLWREAARKGIEITTFPEYMPCGAIFDSASVISPEGANYTCAGFIGMKKFLKGHLNVTGYTPRHTEFMELNIYDECKGCSYVPICGGGCRWLAYVYHGDWRAKHCERTFFEKAFPEYLKLRYHKQRLENIASNMVDKDREDEGKYHVI
jgi:uncharacterized protein